MKVIQNLLTVKSIVTLVLTVVFAYLSVTGQVSGEQFLTIFSIVVAFYFGTQYRRVNKSEGDIMLKNFSTIINLGLEIGCYILLIMSIWNKDMMGLLLAGFLLVHNELMAIRVALEGNQSVREDKENEDKVC